MCLPKETCKQVRDLRNVIHLLMLCISTKFIPNPIEIKNLQRICNILIYLVACYAICAKQLKITALGTKIPTFGCLTIFSIVCQFGDNAESSI